jgi:phosphoglycolate phosphatase
MLEYIMNQLSVSKQHTVMIGDSSIDIEFANNAGVDSIAVTFGAHNESILLKQKPTFMAHNYHDLYQKSRQIC